MCAIPAHFIASVGSGRISSDRLFAGIMLLCVTLFGALPIKAQGGSVIAYTASMDTGPGWSLEGQWNWGQPSGGGGEYGSPDPSGGYTGANLLGYNLSGDYPNGMDSTDWATTPPIDCSGLTGVKLRFYQWLGVEQSLYDHASIEVTNDGYSWYPLWQNEYTMDGGTWEYVEYDISIWADDQHFVQVRWGMGPTDSSWRYCGWNLDDVTISGDPLWEPPSNDECLAAIEIRTGVPISGTSLGATGSDISSCAWNDFDDVWYRWTPESGGQARISLCIFADFDTTLAVYDGCGGAQLACNDDACAFQSRLEVAVDAGREYLVRVAGYGGGAGEFTLQATLVGENDPWDPADPNDEMNLYEIYNALYGTDFSSTEEMSAIEIFNAGQITLEGAEYLEFLSVIVRAQFSYNTHSFGLSCDVSPDLPVELVRVSDLVPLMQIYANEWYMATGSLESNLMEFYVDPLDDPYDVLPRCEDSYLFADTIPATGGSIVFSVPEHNPLSTDHLRVYSVQCPTNWPSPCQGGLHWTQGGETVLFAWEEEPEAGNPDFNDFVLEVTILLREYEPPVWMADAGPDQQFLIGEVASAWGNPGAYHYEEPPQGYFGYSWSFHEARVGGVFGHWKTLIPDLSSLTRKDLSQSSLCEFVPDLPGAYVLELSCYDGVEHSSPDTATITVINATPVAVISAPSSVRIGSAVTPTGAGSYDQDFYVAPFSYAWELASRPTSSRCALFNMDTVQPTLFPDLAGDYTLRLTVTDSFGLPSNPTTATVTASGAALGLTRWVDFSAQHPMDGSSSNPYNTLLLGAMSVPDGGVVKIHSGVSPETIRLGASPLNKAMRIESLDGPVVIGRAVPKQVPNSADSPEYTNAVTTNLTGPPPFAPDTLISEGEAGPERNGEPHLCRDFPEIQEQFYLFRSLLGVIGDDLDADGLPEDAALALVRAVVCSDDGSNLWAATMNALWINHALLGIEVAHSSLEPYREVLAALLAISGPTQAVLTQVLNDVNTPLTAQYEVARCDSAGLCMPSALLDKALEEVYQVFALEDTLIGEPFAGTGDPDGDGVSNTQEYANATDAGGTLAEFVIAALDPTLNGSQVGKGDSESAPPSCHSNQSNTAPGAGDWLVLSLLILGLSGNMLCVR